MTVQLNITTQDLNDEQREIFEEYIKQQIKHHDPSIGLGAFIDFITESHNLLQMVSYEKKSGLEVIVQCPTLESLESLLNNYGSGNLIEVAERCLMGDEIKGKLSLDTLGLKMKALFEVSRK